MRDDFDRVICGPGSRGVYESIYLRAVHPGGAGALWIKHNLMAPTDGSPRSADLWAIIAKRPGTRPVVVRQAAGEEELTTRDAPIDFRTSRVSLTAEGARGSLESGGRRVEWDLALEGSERPLRPLPGHFLYVTPFPKKKLLVQRPGLVFRGRVVVDGEAIDVDGWPGFQGHNWGAEHPLSYAYSTCNSWNEPGEWIFNGFSGRIALGPVSSPWLSLAALRTAQGELRFDRPTRWVNSSARVEFPSWSCTYRNGSASLRVRCDLDPEDAAGLRYLSPDGRLAYCYNSQFGDLEVVLDRGGGRSPDRRTAKTAEIEILTEEPIPGIPLHGPDRLGA